MNSPSPRKRRSLSAADDAASSYHRFEGRQPVGLSRRFVDANTADAREAHGEARLVAAALVDRIERDLEHEALLNLAHRAEALYRVAADPAVEPFQLLVGEAEVRLADGKELFCLGPAAESVVAVIAGPLPGPPLGVHQHAVGGQRIALPFVPQACAAPGNVGTVTPLEHDPFDAGIAGVQPEVFELLEALRLDQLRDIEPVGIDLRSEALEARSPLGPAEVAQVLIAIEEDIVEPNESGIGGQHLLADVLSPEPLLK